VCLIGAMQSKSDDMERVLEIQRLNRLALDRLNALPETDAYICIFSFWTLPSFRDQNRVSVYTPHPRSRESDLVPFMSKTTWRRTADLDKVRNPVERLKHPRELEPTMEEATKSLSPSLVDDAVRELSTIEVPSLMPNEVVLGLDGVRFRFLFNKGYYGLDLSWWAHLPSAWQEPTQRIQAIVARLETTEI
jgi:hypothetical protein